MNQDLLKEDRDYFLSLTWTFRKWIASPALKDKSVGGGTRLFNGQNYDNIFLNILKMDGHMVIVKYVNPI